MSGHSKWATIKHRKGAADKRRGKLFARLIRQVEVAAELRHLTVGIHEVARHLRRVGSGVPDPADPVHARRGRDQPGEARRAFAVHRAAASSAS